MNRFRPITRIAAFILVFSLLTPLSVTASAVEEPPLPKITCKAAVVMDFDTGEVLYSKDPDTLRVPASMTKVMTAYIIYEELAKGTFTMDTMVPISDWVAKISRDSVHYEMVVPLPYDGYVPVSTLLKLMMIYSASASCVAMAELISGSEEAFVVRMNETARRLGLDATYVNSHGHLLNYITARSQAKLIRQFIMDYPEILEITSLTSVTYDDKEYRTTNNLLPGEEYEYEGVDGFKTGYVVKSGYCQSVTCVRNGRRLVAVAMNSSSGTTRATDCVKLLDYGYAKLETMGKFVDLENHWARSAVEELDALGVELHTEGHAFRPDEQITRAEFTAMFCSALEIYDLLPEPVEHTPPEELDPDAVWPFGDIADSWAADYIIKAWDRGLVNGSGELTFSPDAPISRQEIMVILDRAIHYPDANGLNFSDVGDVAFWALQSAARLTAAGVFTGSDGRLNPTATTTRAEAAQIIARLA